MKELELTIRLYGNDGSGDDEKTEWDAVVGEDRLRADELWQEVLTAARPESVRYRETAWERRNVATIVDSLAVLTIKEGFNPPIDTIRLDFSLAVESPADGRLVLLCAARRTSHVQALEMIFRARDQWNFNP